MQDLGVVSRRYPEVLKFSPHSLVYLSENFTNQCSPTTGSTFSPSTTRIISIPIQGGDLLNCHESYLSFSLKNNNTTEVINVDYSAYSLFERIRIIGSNGYVLSDISNVNVYMTRLLMSKTDPSYSNSTGTFMGSI